jgi:Na+-transporting NADH:ubiquinone oxidoreductase subunit C
MSNASPRKALLVVFLTAVVCSSLVSAAVVILRPIQLDNQMLLRGRNIVQLTGQLTAEQVADDEQVLKAFKSLDARLVNVDEAQFDDAFDPRLFDMRRAVNDPELSTAVPAELDLANLGRRSRYVPIFLVWNGSELERVILPVRGAGMWSMMYGYIALEADLNTVAGMTFYEQNETPGLGDQITHEHWLEQWRGREIFNDQGKPVFRVSDDTVRPGSDAVRFEVDALSGATVTANAVTALIRYWFGENGYGPFLSWMRENPPDPAEEGA